MEVRQACEGAGRPLASVRGREGRGTGVRYTRPVSFPRAFVVRLCVAHIFIISREGEGEREGSSACVRVSAPAL